MIKLAEHGYLPDRWIRIGIAKLLKDRLASIKAERKSASQWIELMEQRPLAEHTDAANDQHYEIPAAYFELVLGPHLKYSSGLWNSDTDTLESSEVAMLRTTSERAQLANGQDILELGCGWGSLSLWMAAQYPSSRITAVSNSSSQRAYIETTAADRGLNNLRVITCDINNFTPDQTYDRIVSVEMFEHVRNHRKLLKRIHDWLEPRGKLFVHIFAHKSDAYLFEANSSKDWMSKYFFTGGIMPSRDLLPSAAESLDLEASWSVNGTHYSRTLEAWLQNQDSNREKVLRIFKDCYGAKEAKIWAQRWRMFYMACSELFGHSEGNEWMVMHYRFTKS